VTDFTGDEPLGLLGRHVSPAFERSVRILPTGYAGSVGKFDWSDSLVEVAQGEIELEFTGGERRRFETGDVLWFDGLPIRVLYNGGPGSAVLVAIRRRRRR
jgi:hypothetical protein